VLAGANLNGVVLREVNLPDANLRNAHLLGADLCRANLMRACLRSADLRRARLNDADLSYANLRETDLRGTDLDGTDLSGADLKGADLRGANLRGADLSHADLSDVVLDGAELHGVNLCYAVLSEVDLSGAHFGHVELGATVMTGVDIGPLMRATISHYRPSTVDWATIVKSLKEPRLKEFLRGAGMPEVFVEYMVDCARSLDPEVVFSLLQSTFISYGGPDEAFARKLNDALKRRGVTTFFFQEDAPPGERLHRVMRKGVNEHDRTILICSEASLQRAGLLNELEETLAREARDGGRTYLLPVRLDDYVLKGWAPHNPDVAQTVRDRVIADFRRHEVGLEFTAEVAKLIAVLKKPVAHK